MIITGKSERYSREILKKIKTHFDKEDYQCISIKEFCLYMGLDESLIQNLIQ